MLLNNSFLSIRSSKYPISEQFVSSVCFEFHINKSSRATYKIEETLFESSGNIIFPNFRAVRELTYAINRERKAKGMPGEELRSGYLNAVGLLDEISHFLVRMYDEKENPGVMKRAYQHVELNIGKETFEKTLKIFLEEFPAKAIHQNQQSVEEYFISSSLDRPHKEIALEEMVMLFLSNLNAACKNVKELFDDSHLTAATSYQSVITQLEQFFSTEKPFGPDNQPLFEALKKPILEHPESIEAQLGFLKERWGIILSPKFLERIEGSFEFSKEEEKFIWNTFNQFGGKAVVETFVPEYKKTRQLSPEERKEMLRRGLIKPEDYIYAEPEQFTPDTDWMPNVVLIAKNIYVWLDQLSKKYQREIKRLDQIPDEELDQLARWSFTSLWLIGVWERSSASKRIKQITGNLDAVSSAYSLFDYEIANDLGGEESFQNLNRRCWQRGIRLAGDMVPNHMGLYSKWVTEHPEYFIQTEHPPYPNYRFTGENLSADPNIELRIEDGYWSRNDAAVVFQRIDRRSGETRYVYHGNDGTSMPWNDTAQLNLLRADVREAVIQNILHVARKFSVIRFDAAMTLAKKHFQRLWYPMPGTSGVPSRQDHSLSRAEFDAMFPNEFWREVVDRFNAEMPQTLLLAEAFWLMEGYFVRTLGMHRVYNSAFMHMLMKEENEKFRATIKNTLEFNPEILKRYVNFMSNPDEQTAVEQFGKGDKYFGVATLMITLPGLPMFAHGQIEGFNEKYGMEYQRAYYNEVPDELLIRRHEYEIFPLTKKRYLFSQVHHFEFYDFLDERGFVNENVIAYSNRAGNERAILFFHNKFAECKGYVKHSLPKATGNGGNVRSVTLSQSLQFQYSEKIFYRFRDRKTTNEYLISGKDLSDKGMRIELHAFEYAVFTDFQEILDTTGEYTLIAQRLNGKGTGSLDSLLIEMRLQPLHSTIITAFEKFDLGTVLKNYEKIFAELGKQFDKKYDPNELKKDLVPFIEKTKQYFSLTSGEQKGPKKTSKTKKKKKVERNTLSPIFIILYKLVYDLKKYSLNSLNGAVHQNSIDLFQQLHLHDVITKVLLNNGNNRSTAENIIALLRNLLRIHHSVIESDTGQTAVLETVLNDFETASFLGVNQHNDLWFFNKEQFATLMTWVTNMRVIFKQQEAKTFTKEIVTAQRGLNSLYDVSERSGYQVERLKELLAQSLNPKTSTKKITKKGNSVKGPLKKKLSKKHSPGVKKSKMNNVKRVTKR